MKIHYLWHSEFLVEIENNNWEKINILCDSWLSDYVFWDMMKRYPTLEIDYSKLKIDVIFLSHSHSDHLDPYILTEIYKNIIPRPTLLIPETMEFLIPIFKKYLPKQKIEILKNNKTFNFKWIDITWIIFQNDYLTNEDDVMTLAISNDKELLYTDVDTVPPENEESINLLYDLFTQKNYESALYLSTRNELPWNFKIIWSNSTKQRIEIEKSYKEERSEEIEYNYYRFEEDFPNCSDIQELPYFLKWLIWQWIVHPNEESLKLRILKLEEEALIETKIAKKYQRNFKTIPFTPGKTHLIKNWNIEIWENIYFLNNFSINNPKTDLNTDFFMKYISWPLDERPWNYKAQEQKILKMLNSKFLPYYLWNSEDNLKNAILNSKNSKYVVKIRYWNSLNYFERNYYFSFWSMWFEEEIWKHWEYNEDYWANDLEDFLEGSQELYTNFWHTLTPKKTYRVWTMLWANFLNNDILYKKYDFHFKRAKAWRSVESFIPKKIKDVVS